MPGLGRSFVVSTGVLGARFVDHRDPRVRRFSKILAESTMFFGRFLAGTDPSHCPVKDVDQNSTRTFISAHVPRAPDQGPALAGDGGSTFADHQKRPAGHPVCPARGPGCNGAPCEGDRADPCADSAITP